MNKVYFVVEKIQDDETGQVLDALVKHTRTKEGEPDETETWCTILDLDRLFETCVRRWGKNWNLDKVCIAINESEIE